MSTRRTDAGAAISGLFSGSTATGGLAGRRTAPAPRVTDAVGAMVRQGVELTDDEVAFLRSLSRPSRTGQPRTLGSKFVATGVLKAAIELLARVHVDMDGVRVGDDDAMKQRALTALVRAAREGEL
jgi:hypothetical protein